MENTINYGIDLGTTNSAIAKFIKGEVVIFSNPQDMGSRTLPSIVGYKKDKILVGKQARVFAEREPENVKSVFKRKMGTAESFPVKSLNQSKTPIELSTEILKELKTFVNNGDILDAVVITIPASFGVIQSNATKEAGVQAGFKQVILLQEPIAASLAYANMKKEKEMQEGQWLVYDLGGGTFDVALIKIKDGEMKVIDHEGDNFLGGADFDRMIIEKLIIPKLSKEYYFSNLEDAMKSTSGKYNALYLRLLSKVEDAKIILSAKKSTEIEVLGFEDEEGSKVDLEIIITRSEFNEFIKSEIDRTIEMIKKILTKNSLKPTDLQFILMVGGSTYIPYIRSRVEEVLQIPINCEIDPTIAVATGAAYFAATRKKEIIIDSKEKKEYQISINYSCPDTKDKDVLFSARISGDIENLSYRITRADGGYNSGLKKLTKFINEELPLINDAFNYFAFSVYDDKNNIIETDLNSFAVNSTFTVIGQPIPEDICLEVDDYENPGQTKLELIFQKNTILPARRTVTFPLTRGVIKGSDEHLLIINVLEGTHLSLPEANKSIGFMSITGNQVKRDITKRSDVEITIIMTESRDLTVSAYINMADQEFKEIFNPKTRHVPITYLKVEVEELADKLETEIQEASISEDYGKAASLTKLKKEMDIVSQETESLTNDDSTDKPYQLEDKKRKIAQEIYLITSDKYIQLAKAEYTKIRSECAILIDENGNDHERKTFNDIVAQESAFFATNSPIKIQEKSDELDNIISKINWRTPEFLKEVFQYLKNNQSRMNDAIQAKSFIDSGNFHIASENWSGLADINRGLLSLLSNRTGDEKKYFQGI